MLDFPASPEVGDRYTVGAASWAWDGVKWTGISSESILYPFLLTPQMFGATGTADDTAVFQEAIDYAFAQGGASVFIPAGDYNISTLTLRDNVHLIGQPGCRIIQIGTATSLLNASGTAAASVALTAAAARGALQITVASTAGLLAGDWILISDNYQYHGPSVGYISGELAQILTVDDATQVTFMAPLYGTMFTGNSYALANSSIIRKITPVRNIAIKNIEFVGDKSSVTLIGNFTYVQGLTIEGNRINGSGNQGFRLDTCLESGVRNCVIYDLHDIDIPLNRAGYAINVTGASYKIDITNNKIGKCRHGVTTTSGPRGYPHMLSIIGNEVSNTVNAGLDVHPAGDDVLFADNIITGCYVGIQARSIHTTVRDNKITMISNVGIAINPTATDVRVINNEVRETSVAITVDATHVYMEGNRLSNTRRALFIDTVTSDISFIGNKCSELTEHGVWIIEACPRLRVEDNDFVNLGLSGIDLFNQAAADSPNVRIRNNRLRHIGLEAPAYPIIIRGVGTFNSISKLIISDNDIDIGDGEVITGIDVGGADNTTCEVMNNRMRGAPSVASFSISSVARFGENNVNLDEFTLTPPMLTADVGTFFPTGLTGARVIRLSSNASVNIGGLAQGYNGRRVGLYNVGGSNIVLLENSDTAGTLNTRFFLSSNMTLLPRSGIELFYDGTEQRWRAAVV